MARKSLIAGNWKMNGTRQSASDLIAALKVLNWETQVLEVAVFPPFHLLSLALAAVSPALIAVGAQDVSAQKPGAFTGEVAAEFLVDVGCQYALVGHSERRQYHREDDALVAAKLRRLLEVGLKPVVCVGELLAEREQGQTFDVVARQLSGALGGLNAEQMGNVALAYEPVWAIGTGKVASPAQAQEVHAFIRQCLMQQWNKSVADGLQVLYGGSVNAANAKDLLAQKDIDGALVGGASLKAQEFAGIIAAGMAVATAGVRV